MPLLLNVQGFKIIWCVNTYIEVVKSVGDPADPSDKLERLSESEPSEVG